MVLLLRTKAWVNEDTNPYNVQENHKHKFCNIVLQCMTENKYKPETLNKKHNTKHKELMF